MKTNLSYTGWLRLVTGDSKEESMIFRHRQTLHYNIYIIIIIKPCFNIGSASKEEKIWHHHIHHHTIKMGPLLRHDDRYLTNSLLFTSLNHDTTGLCCRWGNGNLWAAWLCAHPPPWSIVLDHPCCSAHPVDRGAGLNCWRKPQAGWNF